jgi:D-beta-D-heptose 7-phosphate kinase/D-beta-D-heptose 1-phosphate adenosyltransferase
LPQTRQIKVLVDPTPSTIQKIKFSYLIKPNRKEAEVFARETIHKDWSNLLSVAETIKKHTEAENVFITLGADGMALLENGKIERFPVFVRNLYDVCGAGDTSIAILGAGLSSGLNLKDSLLLSAVASGLVVERIGTSVCTIEELLDFARHHSL